MKKLLPYSLLLLSYITIAQTPCVNGMAGAYPCSGMDLQSRISLTTMNAFAGNDSWGWTDPQDGKEYGIMGLDNGTAFIDITDPINPIYLGKLPTHTDPSIWRDIKVYNDHAFIVSEASGHGMQVFDLTRLRNVPNPPATFTEDAHYNGIGNCHNIVINEETGFAYAVGASSTNGGGPIFINIQNPTNPTFAGDFTNDFYCHDAQVVIYNGPDTDYTGREILLGSNEDFVSIVDVTDKNNPQAISRGFYANTAYTHQGWLTEDQRYFILGDEIDEEASGFNTRTIIFDLLDLDNPQVAFYYEADNESIDHNGYVLGDEFFLSSYRAGLRILDITDLANGNMTETKFFDTYPDNNGTSYNGAWSVYPYFASGNVVISDIDRGFFVVKASEDLSTEDNAIAEFSIYPNPANHTVNIASKNTPVTQVELFNLLGQRIFSQNFSENLIEKIDVSAFSSGMYVMKINGVTTKRLLIK
ncbi:choice-of-anchor B family protein [Aequorivita echinoideorum]|uniref:Choice-of-anchor B family protein n=1 Tax=Aequorivita echinoideorum TaxID=1549647 RepID=A0ABS5S525_9FLAO|nr:choice-of-anchor B family protein [Aequorivita echinoideorum]MBT0606955.1 choice-of-anchor B family protein [Aequorivita echinoideorum]